MTHDEIIEMAVAAGITPWTKHEYIGNNNFSASDEGMDGDLASLIQFAQLVAAKEREEFMYRLVKNQSIVRQIIDAEMLSSHPDGLKKRKAT